MGGRVKLINSYDWSHVGAAFFVKGLAFRHLIHLLELIAI